MNNEDSTIRSLNELKTLFDSGAITPDEYESLKKRIIYGKVPADSSADSAPVPATNTVNPVETKIIYPTPNATSKPVRITPPPTSIRPVAEEELYEPEPATTRIAPARKTDWLLISLAILGALLLLGLLGYQFFNKPESERLTSKSGPDTEEVLPAGVPEETTTTEPAATISDQPDRIEGAGADSLTLNQPIMAPETETLPSAATESVASPTNLVSDKDEIIRKASEQLNAYYTDLQAAPFNASNHFAPQVERYYTLTNTTPAAITENISTYHFSEFQDGQSSIENGSMEVVNIGNNTYEVTYIENGSAFRKSKNQQQQIKASVRVKFAPDFKMTYLRQERLLENKLSDVADPSTGL